MQPTANLRHTPGPVRSDASTPALGAPLSLKPLGLADLARALTVLHVPADIARLAAELGLDGCSRG